MHYLVPAACWAAYLDLSGSWRTEPNAASARSGNHTAGGPRAQLDGGHSCRSGHAGLVPTHGWGTGGDTQAGYRRGDETDHYQTSTYQV